MTTLNHQDLITIMNSLGYFFKNGICHGFSAVWIQSCLIGVEAENNFYNRLNFLENYKKNASFDVESLKNDIAQAQETLKFNKDHLPSIELLEIKAFFDAIEIHHHPTKHSDLFSEELTQDDTHILFQFTQSKNLEKQNGMLCLRPKFFALTKNELFPFFSSLEISLWHYEKAPLLISSDDHTVACYFDKTKEKWIYMDINLINKSKHNTAYHVLDSQELAKFLFNSLDEKLCTLFTLRIVTSLTTDNIIDPPSISFEQNLHQMIHFQNIRGTTLLHLVTKAQDLPMIVYLLLNGANPNTVNNLGETPLSLACAYNSLAIVQLFLLYGGIINPSDNTPPPLWLACLFGHLTLVKLLVENGASLNQHHEGQTPFWLACQNGNFELVKLLFENGAHIEISNHCAKSPLYIACQNGHFEISKYLLEKRALVNKRANNGKTPIWVACEKNDLALVKCLLKHHAKLDMLDENGMSLLQYLCLDVSTRKSEFLYGLLLKHGVPLAHKMNDLTVLDIVTNTNPQNSTVIKMILAYVKANKINIHSIASTHTIQTLTQQNFCISQTPLLTFKHGQKRKHIDKMNDENTFVHPNKVLVQKSFNSKI